MKLQPSDGSKDVLFSNKEGHSEKACTRGLTVEQTKEIEDEFLKGNRSVRQIIISRKKNNQEEIQKNKIKYCLEKLRRKHSAQPIISIGELKNYTERSLPNENDDIDIPRVFSSEFPTQNNHSKFRIFISTKRLLLEGQKSENLHIDATYKLLFNGYPVIVIGGSDKNRVLILYKLFKTNKAVNMIFYVFLISYSNLHKY